MLRSLDISAANSRHLYCRECNKRSRQATIAGVAVERLGLKITKSSGETPPCNLHEACYCM